jgi:hypothetical protein
LNSNRFSVADKSNVADSQRHVADVADVALSAGRVCQSIEPCAQCGADDGKQIQFNGVWLHKECKRFYSPDLTVPPHLDRRGELSTKEAQS